MKRPRRRKDKAKTVGQGMEKNFADVAALRPAPHLPPSADLGKYRRHVDHLDLPEDRKAELLQAVWTMMGSFVDRAFGDDPVQQARKPVHETRAADETKSPRVIDCADDPTDQATNLSAGFRKHAGNWRARESDKS